MHQNEILEFVYILLTFCIILIAQIDFASQEVPNVFNTLDSRTTMSGVYQECLLTLAYFCLLLYLRIVCLTERIRFIPLLIQLEQAFGKSRRQMTNSILGPRETLSRSKTDQ